MRIEPQTILQTNAAPWPRRQGKVRDLYDLGDRLVMVATDRVSAFDWVLPNGIADKGKILTAISLFWFDFLADSHHLLSSRLQDMGHPFVDQPEIFAGRSLLVRKTQVIPIECVVRGYLAGSSWKEYRDHGTICGQPLPAGLRESSPLPEPIFTPATKADTGHDENISIARMADIIGRDLTDHLHQRSVSLYQRAAHYAAEKGLILADTKFEFGQRGEEILLIDEVLTPDSSRYWPAEGYRAGGPQLSFDKQFIRDWLESIRFDKQSPPPPMPPDVIAKSRDKYIEAYQRLTNTSFSCLQSGPSSA